MSSPLPPGWIEAPLGSLAEIGAGGPAPQDKSCFCPDGTPFVRVQDLGRLGSKALISETADRLNESGVKTSRLRLIPAGAVLFTKSGMSTLLNQRAILGKDSYIVSHVGYAIPYDGVLSHWLYWALKLIDFGPLTQATTLPSLQLSKVKEVGIRLAPVSEQRRIVAEIEKHFTRLEAAVEALKRARANLRRYRASVLKAACEGRLVPTEAELARAEGRDYEPADKLLARILKERHARWEADQLAKMRAVRKPPKDDRWNAKYKEPASPDTTNLPCLPEGWVWAVLGCLADVHLGKMLSPKAYETGLQQLPYLRNENVQWGRIDTIDVKMMGFKQQELERYCVETNHLLVCEGGEAGRAAVYAGPSGEFMYQKALHRVRPIAGLVSPYFIQFCFWHYVVSGVVIPRPSETTIQHLPLERMVVLPIPLPPLAEQRRIVAEVERRLSVIDELVAAVEANLKRAERLGQAILKRAFEGRLVPQDPSDEPASVLLERIRAEREAAKPDSESRRQTRGIRTRRRAARGADG